MGVDRDEGAAVGEHPAPIGCGRPHSQPEKRQGGLKDDGVADGQGGEDDDRADDVWDQVAPDDAAVCGPDGPGGSDEVLLAQA